MSDAPRIPRALALSRWFVVNFLPQASVACPPAGPPAEISANRAPASYRVHDEYAGHQRNRYETLARPGSTVGTGSRRLDRCSKRSVEAAMRLLDTRCFSGLAAIAVLGCVLSGTAEGQTPPISGTEAIARELEVELEIVGRSHPELPDFEDGYENHGGFSVNFRDGGIAYARLTPGNLLQQVFVFYRNWQDDGPRDARGVGCPAERDMLEKPVECFRAVLRKMEGGRGPVLLEVRYYGMGQRAATIPVNTVRIPWSYLRHYAKMEPAGDRR